MEAMQEVRAYVADMAEPTIEQFSFAHVDTTSEYWWRTVYKNELMATFTHRFDKAAYARMYNAAILREWKATMDLQRIHKANAAVKYILGYVLKSDSDKRTGQEFEHYIKARQLERGASARDVCTCGAVWGLDQDYSTIVWFTNMKKGDCGRKVAIDVDKHGKCFRVF
eukprot:3699814-Amphidinium_carterae.1